MITLGKRLKELRKIKGETQEKLAAVLDVEKTTISNYENDYSQPDIEKMIKLSEHFDVSLDYLAKGETANDASKTFGQRLKVLRLHSGMTQEDVSNHLGLESSTGYAFYEQGKREPKIETLVKLSQLFNASVDYLLGNTTVNSDNHLERRLLVAEYEAKRLQGIVNKISRLVGESQFEVTISNVEVLK